MQAATCDARGPGRRRRLPPGLSQTPLMGLDPGSRYPGPRGSPELGRFLIPGSSPRQSFRLFSFGATPSVAQGLLPIRAGIAPAGAGVGGVGGRAALQTHGCGMVWGGEGEAWSSLDEGCGAVPGGQNSPGARRNPQIGGHGGHRPNHRLSDGFLEKGEVKEDPARTPPPVLSWRERFISTNLSQDPWPST